MHAGVRVSIVEPHVPAVLFAFWGVFRAAVLTYTPLLGRVLYVLVGSKA